MRKGILNRILWVYLTLIAVIYSVGLSISLASQARVREHLVEAAAAQVNFIASGLDADIRYLVRQQRTFANDYALKKMYLYTPEVRISEVVDSIGRTRLMMTAIRHFSPFIEDVAVFFPQLGRVLRSGSRYETIRPEDAAVLERLCAGEGPLAVLDGDLYVIRSMTSQSLREAQNLSYIKLSGARISETMAPLATANGMSVTLMVDSQTVLSVGAPSAAPLPAPVAGGEAGTAQVGGLWDRTWVIRSGISPQGVEIVARLHGNTVEQIILPSLFVVFLLLTAATVLSVLGFRLWVNRILVHPVAGLAEAFHAVESDNLDVRLDENSALGEFGYLYGAFNAMVRRLQNTVHLVYRQTIAAQKAELKQLQSQINPHFLYNSFFHIYRMSRMGDAENAAEFSLLLSQFYQYVTRNRDDVVPLKLELQHAQSYADIQSIRFGDRIVCSFGTIPPGADALPVPKLILQPILENAYVHGLEEECEDARISVSFAEEEGGILCITIQDNGSRLSDETLEGLRARLEHPPSDIETTGIVNIAQRLRFLYGDGGLLTATRSESGGLRVDIRLPPIGPDGFAPEFRS